MTLVDVSSVVRVGSTLGKSTTGLSWKDCSAPILVIPMIFIRGWWYGRQTIVLARMLSSSIMYKILRPYLIGLTAGISTIKSSIEVVLITLLCISRVSVAGSILGISTTIYSSSSTTTSSSSNDFSMYRYSISAKIVTNSTPVECWIYCDDSFSFFSLNDVSYSPSSSISSITGTWD